VKINVEIVTNFGVKKSSKTDPFRMSCSITPAPSGRSFSAVRAMRRYLAHQLPGNPNPRYFFSTGQFLTRHKVTSILRLQLQRSVSPQSPMHTTVSVSGLKLLPQRPACTPWLIQNFGHWSSDCYTQIHQDTCFNAPSSPCPARLHR